MAELRDRRASRRSGFCKFVAF
ncbi:hypothetical protein CCACVL1_03506 [Corchorus capsularis]|uniref:Uncharacterized protein n=1 Tax=Corchorus capsularis TaxID=210143 RepID=A0A1R3JYU8_COCAP|nr:hypothetical protein CCACVL1_03506 [Corchorus capsularis]